MRQSVLFSKTAKTYPKDEESRNAQLLERAGFVRKEMAGVYSFLPLGFKVLSKIAGIITEEMEGVGAQEVFLPSLQPKTNWQTTGRWNDFDVLFRFTSFYTKTEYALGPTHEEIVTPLAKRFIASYRDLPRAIFQIQNKFRDEKRAKSGLLRGREFLMKDLYSFHATEKDLDAYYERVKEAYWKIMERVGLKDRTYFTFAAGGSFSKYSHEFQVVTEAGEDIIYACDECRVAVNEEVKSDQSTCPECGTEKLKKLKAVEAGNIFKLKDKYSSVFKLVFVDEKGEERPVLMSCYGIGLSRLMGVVAEVFGDEKGLLWPQELAPYKVHLLALQGGEDTAEKAYTAFTKAKCEVLYDDRDVAAGEKFADSDLIGIPLRVVASKKTKGKLEVKARRGERTEFVSVKDVLKKLE